MRFFLLTFTITFLIFEVQSSDNVGKVKDFGNLKFPNSRIAYINPTKGAIYEINQEGQITWSYAIPQQVIGSGKLRKGADIEWIKETDRFLFVVPGAGIFEVNRRKEIVWSYKTKFVSHDADRLQNGNTIFVNAWDKKGDSQVTEITPDGEVIFKWKISDSGVSCDHETADCYRPNKRGGPPGDYTHVNAVEKFSDGSFLVSLRNLHKVVLIDKELRVVERHRQIRAVHDPRLSDSKIISIGRKQGVVIRDRKPVTSKKDSLNIFRYHKKNFSFLRTNQRISQSKILLTDSTHILIFDVNLKKVIWKVSLDGFGDQRKEKHLPFLFKATWVGEPLG